MTQLPDLSRLSNDEKDALILALWAQVQLLMARVAELEAKLGVPSKTPDNSSVPVVAPEKPDRVWLLRLVHGRARVKPDALRLRATRGWRA